MMTWLALSEKEIAEIEAAKAELKQSFLESQLGRFLDRIVDTLNRIMSAGKERG
jgi:hypothetical protein